MAPRVDILSVANNDGPLTRSVDGTPDYNLLDAPSVSGADVGNVGAGDDTLKSYALAANALAIKQGLRFRATGTFANNANAKTIRAWFGTGKVLEVVLPTSKPGIFTLELLVIRLTAATQRCFAELRALDVTDPAGPVTALFQGHLDTTEDETAAITVKATAEAVANNDVVAKTLLVESF